MLNSFGHVKILRILPEIRIACCGHCAIVLVHDVSSRMMVSGCLSVFL